MARAQILAWVVGLPFAHVARAAAQATRSGAKRETAWPPYGGHVSARRSLAGVGRSACGRLRSSKTRLPKIIACLSLPKCVRLFSFVLRCGLCLAV